MSKHFPAHDPYTAHDHHYANPRPTPSTARDPLKDPPGETEDPPIEAEAVEEEIDGDDTDDQQIADTDDQQIGQGDEDDEEELAAPAPNMVSMITK